MSDTENEFWEADVDGMHIPLFGSMERTDMFGLPVIVFTRPEFCAKIGFSVNSGFRYPEQNIYVFPHRIVSMEPITEDQMLEKMRRQARMEPDTWRADPSFHPGNPDYDEFMARST